MSNNKPLEFKYGIERYSFYVGIGAICWWIIVIGYIYISTSVTMLILDSLFIKLCLIFLFIIQFVGIVVSCKSLFNKLAAKKYAVTGLILNGSSFLVVSIMLMAPFIMDKMTYLPSTQEIMTKYPEFLVQPSDIEGLEAVKLSGTALFKYQTKNTSFSGQLEKQALVKGWVNHKNENNLHTFERDKKHIKQNGKLVIYEYDLARVYHDDKSGKTCVGYAEIFCINKVSDINQTVEAQELDRTVWCNCISGR